MSPPDPQLLDLPSSYASLPFQQIRVSHVPESSSDVTPVVVVTLYRPKNYNAFTSVMASELEKVYALLDVDERVKCVVMTGHGKMFCAGADLSSGTIGKDEKADDKRAAEHRDGGGRVGLAIHRCRKPVIGALHGHAVGVGITMCLPMTIRLASSSAKIAFPFARRGIIPEAASAYFLPRLIGYSRALHLVTTGETLPCTHPLLNGLFSEILDAPEKVLPRALELADMIVRNTSTVSVALARDLIWRGPDGAEESHLLTSRLIRDLFRMEDHEEGVRSFMEKREPKFRGTLDSDAPDAYPWWNEVDIGNRAKAGKGRGEKAKL